MIILNVNGARLRAEIDADTPILWALINGKSQLRLVITSSIRRKTLWEMLVIGWKLPPGTASKPR